MIRPVVRLADATRYIVAIRATWSYAGGKALPPTPVFQALPRRDRLVRSTSVALRKDLYADIFGKLEKAGVARKDLQIAWDYTTASRQNNTARFLKMRDDALAKVGNDGPAYTLFPPAAAGTAPDPAGPSSATTSRWVPTPLRRTRSSPSEIGSGHCSQGQPPPRTSGGGSSA